MNYTGTLKKVFDNETKARRKFWAVIIETDEHGEIKFNLWDTVYAGIPNDNGDLICDVHEMEGCRVVVDARPGSLKDKNNPEGDRWPSTIEAIMLEGAGEHTPVREMVEEMEEASAAEEIMQASEAIENETVRAVGVNNPVVQKFILGVRKAADEALAEMATEEVPF